MEKSHLLGAKEKYIGSSFLSIESQFKNSKFEIVNFVNSKLCPFWVALTFIHDYIIIFTLMKLSI